MPNYYAVASTVVPSELGSVHHEASSKGLNEYAGGVNTAPELVAALDAAAVVAALDAAAVVGAAPPASCWSIAGFV